MFEMSEPEWKAFVTHGTRTGKLATVRRDGRPHVMPIWFVLDADEFVFMTGARTVKGRTLTRAGLASLCVDEQSPPYSFVTVSGPVRIASDPAAMLPLSIRIAARYMGRERAQEYGRRNAVEGELLVRLRPTSIVAMRDLAD